MSCSLLITRGGNRYIVAMVGYSTNWGKPLPVLFEDAVTVANFSILQWVCQYGTLMYALINMLHLKDR